MIMGTERLFSSVKYMFEGANIAQKFRKLAKS